MCRQGRDNSRFLRCFFHAWTFDTSGSLVSLPDEAAYGPSFDRAEHSLVSPPHVDEYRGFVFVSYDVDAPPLTDYLAGAGEWLDLLCAQGGEEGMEVLGGTHEYAINANWKLLAENSIDGYHGFTTHKRWFDVLKRSGVDLKARISGTPSHPVELGNGHVVSVAPALAMEPNDDAGRAAVAERRARLIESLGEERAALLDHTRSLLIFPNLVIIDLPPGITIRTFEPITPSSMHVTAWPLAPATSRTCSVASGWRSTSRSGARPGSELQTTSKPSSAVGAGSPVCASNRGPTCRGVCTAPVHPPPTNSRCGPSGANGTPHSPASCPSRSGSERLAFRSRRLPLRGSGSP